MPMRDLGFARFAGMVATIYAARLNCYMSNLAPKMQAAWHEYRKQAIDASIAEAVMICEAIERDFGPTHHRETKRSDPLDDA